MARSARSGALATLGLILLTLAGTVSFLYGFLPLKPFLGGFSRAPGAGTTPPPFDRLAFVLVDALRRSADRPAAKVINWARPEVALLTSTACRAVVTLRSVRTRRWPSSLRKSLTPPHYTAYPLLDAASSSLSPQLTRLPLGSIIESGHALPFTALASPPTVTLPRLKALTTGANPTFLDAILNIADDDSAAVLENVDSWVRQLAVGDGAEDGNRRHVSFVGDDTWLRLFPRRWFHWTQGISSFYVAVSSQSHSLSHLQGLCVASLRCTCPCANERWITAQDTTTVDTNVSRHLNALLADPPVKPSLSPFPSEFDATILHFLGMDHVGHLGGSKRLVAQLGQPLSQAVWRILTVAVRPPLVRSALMGPKQREMDGAIEQLFTRLGERDEKEGRKSLIVLVGDHGMTDVSRKTCPSEQLGWLTADFLGRREITVVQPMRRLLQ